MFGELCVEISVET